MNIFFPCKLRKFNLFIFEIELIIPLSILYIYILHSLCSGQIPFQSINPIFKNSYLEIFHLILAFLTWLLIRRVSQLSFITLIMNFAIVSFQSLRLFFEYEQKLIVIFYLLFSICYLFILFFLREEFKRTIYTSCFNPQELSLRSKTYAQVTIQNHTGILSNFSSSEDNEIVISFPYSVNLSESIYNLTINYQNKIFEAKARLHTSMNNKQSYGLSLVDKNRTFYSKNTINDLLFILEKKLSTL